jgi:acyl carrier protein
MNAEQIIKDILLKKKIIKSEAEFIPSATLEALDIDSLDLLDIVFEAEGIMQIKFPDMRDFEIKNLQDVINLVQDLIDNPPPVNPHHINLEGQPKFADVVKEMAKQERESDQSGT